MDPLKPQPRGTSPQPDQSLPQPVEYDQGLEVAEQSRMRGPFDRQSSLTRPQAYIPVDQRAKEERPYYDQPPEQQPDIKAYYGGPPEYKGHDSVEPQPDRQRAQTRICGMKRTLFFVALAVGILIILGAVLGGALGATLGKSNKSSTSAPSNNSSQSAAPAAANLPVSAYQNGGTALMVPATSSGESPIMYLYYQDAQGNIVESAYENDTMRAMSTETVVNITNAAQRSPIAATSWLLNGNIVRGVFWVDASDGSVMTTNTTGTQPWSVSTPYNILTGDTADRETMALAVHSGNADLNQGLSGIRVVYGSSSCSGISDVPCIREVGCDFFENSAQPVWHMWAEHNGSDVKSGVASVITNNVAHVYWRSADNDTLQQWTWDYFKQYQNQPNAGWNLGTTYRGVPSGSSIAVARDDSEDLDHIFFQQTDGTLMRALFNGSQIGEVVSLETATFGTKLSAAYANGSAEVLYQKGGNASLYYDWVTGNGAETSSGVLY